MLSWALIAAFVGDVVFTVLMRRAAQRSWNVALRERARVSVFLTCGAACYGVLGVAFLANVELPPLVGFGLFALGVVWYFIPQPAWYIAYRLGKFR